MRKLIIISILLLGLFYQLLRPNSEKETYVISELQEECSYLFESIQWNSRKRNDWVHLEDFVALKKMELIGEPGLLQLFSMRNTLADTLSKYSFTEYLCEDGSYAVVDTVNGKVNFYSKLCYSSHTVQLNENEIKLQGGEAKAIINCDEKVQKVSMVNPLTLEAKDLSPI